MPSRKAMTKVSSTLTSEGAQPPSGASKGKKQPPPSQPPQACPGSGSTVAAGAMANIVNASTDGGPNVTSRLTGTLYHRLVF